MDTDSAIKRARELSAREVLNDNVAEEELRKLAEEHPEAIEVIQHYLEMLWFSGKVEESRKLAKKMTLLHPENLYFRYLFCGTSLHLGDIELGVNEYLEIFKKQTTKLAQPLSNFSETQYLFLLTCLLNKNHFDYPHTISELNSIIEENKILTRNGTSDRLHFFANQHLKQVYDNQERQSGFLIFIDLVDSTKYKYEYPDLWQKRILHFLMHTQYWFRLQSFQFIKSMGDEVMLFRSFENGANKADIAKYLIRTVFSCSRYFPHEYSIMNPSQVASDYKAGSVHDIKIKITIGEVQNATVFHPYYNETRVQV